LTLENYQNIGGFERALVNHIRDIYSQLSTEQKACFENLVSILIKRNDNNCAIRNPMRLSDIVKTLKIKKEEIIKVLGYFRNNDYCFFMPPFTEELKNKTVIDISHEILINPLQACLSQSSKGGLIIEKIVNGIAASLARNNLDSNNIPKKFTDEATKYFSADILYKKEEFNSLFYPASFSRLEKIWLHDIKELKAYFRSMDSEHNTNSPEKNFLDVCDEIRERLVNKNIKASFSDFEAVKKYLQENYITVDNMLLPEKGKTKLYKLINKKAQRIYDMRTNPQRNHDITQQKLADKTQWELEKMDWRLAETYVKMFYENIVPAVEKKDREKTLRVLKAFQYSRQQELLIKNCFEVTIAIYFLDADIIKSLWAESAQYPLPDSVVETIINMSIRWPDEFESKIESCRCHSRFKVSSDRKEIRFDGVMLEVEKIDLLTALQQLNHLPQHEEYLNELYHKSRLIHEETTL
jgi:hypothetical protein